jgi:hypothetical protein
LRKPCQHNHHHNHCDHQGLEKVVVRLRLNPFYHSCYLHCVFFCSFTVVAYVVFAFAAQELEKVVGRLGDESKTLLLTEVWKEVCRAMAPGLHIHQVRLSEESMFPKCSLNVP